MDELREARSERDALRDEASVLRDSNKQLAGKLSGTSMLLENLKVAPPPPPLHHCAASLTRPALVLAATRRGVTGSFAPAAARGGPDPRP